MTVLTKINPTTPPANDGVFNRSAGKMIDDAFTAVVADDSFHFAECSIADGVWSVDNAADYLVSKSIGFIDLESQGVLRQYLYNTFKLHLNRP